MTRNKEYAGARNRDKLLALLAPGDLSAVFGVDIDMTGASREAPVASPPRRGGGKKAAVKKPAVKKAPRKRKPRRPSV